MPLTISHKRITHKIGEFAGYGMFGAGKGSRTRGVGRRGHLVSPPCRKLFKTEGFEGGAKRRRVLGRQRRPDSPYPLHWKIALAAIFWYNSLS